MKRLTALMAVGAMTIVLAACGQQAKQPEVKATEQAAPAPAAAAEAAAPAEAPAEGKAAGATTQE
jgi:hypothetical protein